MPSFHSAGTLPVDHTLVMTLCKASLIGFSAPFRCSAVMPSAPAARPFFNRRIALVTSCNIGTSSEIVTSGVAESAKSSRSARKVSKPSLFVSYPHKGWKLSTVKKVCSRVDHTGLAVLRKPGGGRPATASANWFIRKFSMYILERLPPHLQYVVKLKNAKNVTECSTW